jgi:hypothetical protein
MPLPRNRRFRAPRNWSQDIGDLHDYVGLASERTGAARVAPSIIVTDDWPQRVPIGDTELRVIEGHMRSELDDLLGPLP